MAALKVFIEKLVIDGYLKKYVANHQQTTFEQNQAITLRRIVAVQVVT